MKFISQDAFPLHLFLLMADNIHGERPGSLHPQVGTASGKDSVAQCSIFLARSTVTPETFWKFINLATKPPPGTHGYR